MSGRLALSRRQAALGLAAAAATPARAADTPGLNALAAQSGLLFGSGSDVAIDDAPARYAAAIVRECGIFTPSIAWEPVTTRGGAMLAAGFEDPNIAFALQHRMRLAGGTLLRHGVAAADFRAAPAGSVARAIAAAHVDRTIGRYAGQAFSWAVVADAIDVQAGDVDGLRGSDLRQKLGPDFIAAAFRIARQADGRALLAYADAGFEMDTPHHAARRAALLRLLDRLSLARTPVDAVALQTHLRLDGTRFDPAIYRRFLGEIASRGLRIMVTGMEVADLIVAGDVAQRDEAVAASYRDLLAVALAERALVSVATSGLSDRYARQNDPDGGPQRADGLPLRPLPLDDRFQPKPAYAAIADAFRARI